MIRIAGAIAAAFVLLCGSAAASSVPLDAQIINDRIIVEIARQVLFKRGVALDKKKLDETSGEVRSWLVNVGGRTWYQNYLIRFGYPTKLELIVNASLIELSDEKLGLYYIHSVPLSVATMTNGSCVPAMETSPTVRAFCALGNRDAYALFNDRNALAQFRKLARWFLENHKDGRWEWAIDVPLRNQRPPWISGLSQSLGISVLLREYQLENDPAYLEAASKALAWMRRPISEGGVAIGQGNGVWYEEYPDESNPSHVLNGHMWALFGIWDFYRVTHDTVAKRMFDDGISVLMAHIDRFDVGYWSVYALTNRVDIVTGQYQAFIIEQLRVLYAITAIPKFRDVADKWETAMRSDTLFVNIAADDFLKVKPTP